jgi:hypothetical protein
MDKNQQALALAYKKCRGKLLKIKELGITPDMSEADIETMIENLATAKAVEKSTNITEVVAGQRWYVEGLVKFSGYTIEKQLQMEYEDSFAESASEAEMLAALSNLAA